MKPKESIDYTKVGLTCGVEIHQQLDTHKLFCSCPSSIIDGDPDQIIQRRLRMARGESGEIDKAVLHELKKEKSFEYHAFEESCCLVELDEEPPHEISADALSVAIQIAKLLSCTVTHELHVMRKTVVDGSNTSGFQRTGLLAEHGQIEVNDTPISIDSINIEEESAKILERQSTKTIYNLSRLGIPLVEIGTGPDIHTPELAREVCKELGMILRSTGRVKRGIGTIRQDVNVSVARGRRVEIKGAQDLDMIPTIIDHEIIRQESLADLAYQFRGYKSNPDFIDLTVLLQSSEARVVKQALSHENGVVYGIRLIDMKGYIGKEVCPGRRFGTELSDYAKHASGVKGLFHSDELPKYGITDAEVTSIRKKLGCQENDAFIIIADEQLRVKRALQAVVDRINQTSEGVLPEVRDAKPDGTTSYSRPLPGASRMYPETDIKPIILSSEYIKTIPLPELLSTKQERFVSTFGLSTDLAAKIIRECDYFEDMAQNYSDLSPSFIAETIISTPKQIQKKYNLEIEPSKEDYQILFEKIQEGTVAKESVLDILKEQKPVSEIIENFVLLSRDKLEPKVRKIYDQHKDERINVIMGKVMNEIGSKASGKQVMEILKELSEKEQ